MQKKLEQCRKKGAVVSISSRQIQNGSRESWKLRLDFSKMTERRSVPG